MTTLCHICRDQEFVDLANVAWMREKWGELMTRTHGEFVPPPFKYVRKLHSFQVEHTCECLLGNGALLIILLRLLMCNLWAKGGGHYNGDRAPRGCSGESSQAVPCASGIQFIRLSGTHSQRHTISSKEQGCIATTWCVVQHRPLHRLHCIKSFIAQHEQTETLFEQ